MKKFVLFTQALLPVAVMAAVGFTALDHSTMTTTIEQAPKVVTVDPSWGLAEREAFPACRSTEAATGDIPARIVVKTRTGSAKVIPYNDATVAAIDATWDNVDGADDLFTIGTCS